MSLDLDPESFDFDEVGVTEEEYYNLLHDLDDHPATLEVAHSPPLNSITLRIKRDSDTSTAFECRPGLRIRDAFYEEHEEYGNCITLRISTTHFLAGNDPDDCFTPGEYSDEAMAFLKTQVDLFDEVVVSNLLRDGDELKLDTVLDDNFEGAHIFSELMSFMGYSIDTVFIVEGRVRTLRFVFDQSSQLTRESIDAFRYSKHRTWNNAAVDETDPIDVPCGHEASPDLFSIKNVRSEMVEEFPMTEFAGMDVHKVRLEADDVVFDSVAEWPENITPASNEDGGMFVDVRRGFRCEECNTAYLPRDEDELRENYGVDLPVTRSKVSIPDTEESYTFLLFDRPALPVDELK